MRNLVTSTLNIRFLQILLLRLISKSTLVLNKIKYFDHYIKSHYLTLNIIFQQVFKCGLNVIFNQGIQCSPENVVIFTTETLVSID